MLKFVQKKKEKGGIRLLECEDIEKLKYEYI